MCAWWLPAVRCGTVACARSVPCGCGFAHARSFGSADAEGARAVMKSAPAPRVAAAALRICNLLFVAGSVSRTPAPAAKTGCSWMTRLPARHASRSLAPWKPLEPRLPGTGDPAAAPGPQLARHLGQPHDRVRAEVDALWQQDRDRHLHRTDKFEAIPKEAKTWTRSAPPPRARGPLIPSSRPLPRSHRHGRQPEAARERNI